MYIVIQTPSDQVTIKITTTCQIVGIIFFTIKLKVSQNLHLLFIKTERQPLYVDITRPDVPGPYPPYPPYPNTNPFPYPYPYPNTNPRPNYPYPNSYPYPYPNPYPNPNPNINPIYPPPSIDGK